MKRTLDIATATDAGQERDLNEDAVFADQRMQLSGAPTALLIAADGMGGHEAGEVASALAVETIRKRLGWEAVIATNVRDTQPLPSLETHIDSLENDEIRLRLAVEEANTVIVDYAQAHLSSAGNLGATVVAVQIGGDTAHVASVGDSRVYLLRDGALSQLTEDHSFVGELVRLGELSAEAAYDHPQRSVVTRALGNKLDVKVDVSSHRLQSGDRLMLCTDGLWEMVRDSAEIRNILQHAATAAQAAQALVNRANDYGGHDNIGVVVANVL